MPKGASQAASGVTRRSEGSRKAMAAYFPGWTEEPLALPSQTGAQRASVFDPASYQPQLTDGYAEFFLSSNWILRPEGLQEFRAKVREIFPRPEVTWDYSLGCFRVRCPHGEEAGFVAEANKILDGIVRPELQRVPEEKRIGHYGADGSKKIRHVNEWRLREPGEEDLREYEVFAYPPKLAEQPYLFTWRLSEEKTQAGVDVRSLFPKTDPVKTLEASAECAVAMGADGGSLHIGAQNQQTVELVCKKLDNLVKYQDIPAYADMCSHVLYTEDEKQYLVEFRYVAHSNKNSEKMLRQIVLDRRQVARSTAKSVWPAIASGCVLRIQVWEGEREAYMPTPLQIKPSVPKQDALKPFKAFANYAYKSKHRCLAEGVTTQHIHDASGGASVSLSPGRLESTNPQAYPHVLSWAQTVATSTDDSVSKGSETVDARQLQESLLDSPVQGGLGYGLASSRNAWESLVPTPRIAESEERPRVLHSTMRQQAVSRANGNNSKLSGQLGQTPSPYFINMVCDKAKKILRPFRLFNGTVRVKAEIGRFILTKIPHSYISDPNRAQPDRGQNEYEVLEALDKQHTDPRQILFTNAVTLHGGDADYIASLPDASNSGSKMWTPSSARVIYDLTCRTAVKGEGSTKFVIEIDSEDLEYRVRPEKNDCGKVFMHCVKRTFDAQLTFEAAVDLEDNYGAFAREVIESLEIKPQKAGAPHVYLENHQDWATQIQPLRIRHVSEYISRDGTSTMEITQVQQMDISSKNVVNGVTILEAVPAASNPRDGIFTTWYEVCVRSTKLEEAFLENLDLGFADEASWTPDQLQASGAFDDIIKSAADIVTRIDGVGYWCDNHQDAMVHPLPEATGGRQSEEEAAAVTYW